MNKATIPSPVFLIDDWQVYPDLGEIVRDGNRTRLEPKVMEVLLCLVRMRGAVVNKETLIEEVWDGRAVSDIVITRCISVLRSNLDDNSRDPKYIETLPKRGYRLIAAVSEATNEQARASKPTSANPGRRKTVLALLLIIVLITAASRLYENGISPPQPTAAQSIAVLPFVNMSGPEQQYLCDGISEQLIFTLSETPGLAVAARTSSFSFRNTDEDIRHIAEKLSVTSIIEGSVRRAGNTVRVTAQLIDSETGYQLWTGSFDDSIEDTFALQERIATEIAAAVVENPKPANPAQEVFTRPENFAAYDKYLVARFVLNQRRENSLEEAAELFKESVALDPNFGPSYLGLAYTYALLPSYRPVDATETYEDALEVLDAGITADANIAGVGAGVRGFILLKQGDWFAAEAQFQRALQSQYIEPTSYLWYSQLLATVGRLDESLELARLGHEIDPLSPVANSRLAIANLWVGNNQQAQRYFEIASALNIDSLLHTESFALLLVRERRFADVLDLAQHIQLEPGRDIAWLPSLIQAVRDPTLRSAALAELTTAISEDRVSLRVALVGLALLEATEEAITLLQTEIDAGATLEYEILFVEEFAAIRAHPAFDAILEALGLAAYWQSRGCARNGHTLACDP